MDNPGAVSVENWARSLIDVALPHGIATGGRVLFSCDDETVRLAGAELGLDESEAFDALLTAARARWRISQQNGLRLVEQEARRFRQTSRPREIPPYVVALALATIAASRMSPGDGLSTRHYYPRLLSLLRIARCPGEPPIEGFDNILGWWDDLQDWLSEDECGARGLLDHQRSEHHPYVSSCIRQIVFRARDRRHLDGFYAEHSGSLDAGWSARRLLLGWGDRHKLTRPALDVLQDPGLADEVEAALRAGYRAWDGSLVDEQGVRLWPGLLRLYLDPSVVLGLVCPHITHESVAEGPDGAISLSGYPRASAVPISWLTHFARGNVRLGLPNKREKVVIPGGRSLLFEERGEGLERVGGADEQPVWVLSCDDFFAHPKFADRRQDGGVLPDSWVVVHAVEPDELPESMRRRARPDIPQVELRGGLDLGGDSYLAGYAPELIAGPLTTPVDVSVNGEVIGWLRGGEQVALSRICTEQGVYEIRAGQFHRRIELVPQGRRETTISLRWDLGDGVSVRGGACSADRQPATGPFVSGAKLDGVPPTKPDPMLRIRTRAPVVHVLYEDGSVRQASVQEQPPWARQLGLPAPSYVLVGDAKRAVWLLLAGPQPRVRRIGNGEVVITDAAAALCELFGSVLVHPLAEESAWRDVCRAALAAEEVPTVS
jgi:hypothetical protein